MELSCGSFCSINCVVRRVKIGNGLFNDSINSRGLFFSLFLYPKSIFFFSYGSSAFKKMQWTIKYWEHHNNFFLSTYSSPWIPRAYSQHLLTKFNIYSAMLRTVIAQKVCWICQLQLLSMVNASPSLSLLGEIKSIELWISALNDRQKKTCKSGTNLAIASNSWIMETLKLHSY